LDFVFAKITFYLKKTLPTFAIQFVNPNKIPMYTIQRNNETTEAGGQNGVATQEVENKEVTTEAIEKAEDGSENASQETEAEEFIAEFTYEQEEGEAKHQATNGVEGAAATPEKTVSEKDYNSLKEQFAESQRQLQELTQAFQNPLVKASVEFVVAKGAGVEIDPQEFYSQKFGIDAKRLSEDQLIEESVKREAKLLNVNLTEEELETEIENEKDKFNSMSKLERKKNIEAIRAKISQESEGKINELLAEKIENANKGKEFWERQTTNFRSNLEKAKKEGLRKSYDFTYKFTEQTANEIEVADKNGLMKYNKDEEVDIEHYIEACLFSANPKRYLKAFESALRNKWDAEQYAKRKGGQDGSPSNATVTNSPTVANKSLKGFSLDKAKKVEFNN
jgi:hypothetical protein